MVFGESPASIILATSSRIAPLETSDSSLSPMFGRTQALSASCQPEMVAGFTGFRLRSSPGMSCQYFPYVGSPDGPWHLANSPALSSALPIAYFDSLGLPRLFDGYA